MSYFKGSGDDSSLRPGVRYKRSSSTSSSSTTVYTSNKQKLCSNSGSVHNQTFSKLLSLRCNNRSSTNDTSGRGDPKHNKPEDEDGEDLNDRFLEFLSQYFRCLKPRQARKNRFKQNFPWLETQYTKYHEHLSQAICRYLQYHGDQQRVNKSTSNNKDSSTGGGGSDTGIGGGCCIPPSSHHFYGGLLDGCPALKSVLYHQYCPGTELYSRKVFVGGLPVDVDEEELVTTFSRFGPLIVDWPNKMEAKSYFPPKGYVFLIFAHEMSVRMLCKSCFVEDDRLILYLSSPLSSEKMIQIRPWKVADADYVVQPSVKINPRRAVFVGGVPRPIKAVELAHIMEKLYGPVACAGIDTDVEYKYPKGAGRVVFFSNNSFLKAISDRYVQLNHGDIEKRVELKPYVLDDQPCDECRGDGGGGTSGGNGFSGDSSSAYAPFFCPQMSCLQYYCEECWTSIHSQPGFEDHKPLIKEA